MFIKITVFGGFVSDFAMKIENTPYYSKCTGRLADGCKYCVKGEKLVLFVTGICPRKCYYCPISDKKYGKDVIYANERPVEEGKNAVKQIIKEAEICDAKGAGFTGGDPLCKMNRTIKFIKALKKRFGKKFHIHLYTSFDLVNKKNLTKLFKAGLDEIRFHADIDNDKLWNRILIACKFNWDIGIEIPVVPDKVKQTKRLVDYFSDKIDFLNLNELEVADNKISRLAELGYMTKDRISYAVKGSEKAAIEMMKYVLAKKYKLNVHFCTAKLKDAVQLAKRLLRRAKNAAKEYDIVDDEGLLIRGALYYNGNLNLLRKKLMKEFDIPSEFIETDKERKRLLTTAAFADENKDILKKKGLKVAIVQEYPTWDRLQVVVDFL
jgi:pyruvate formate-lyase activating enzyme-like uncharacterized protein